MAKLPKEPKQPEQFSFKVPYVEVSGTGEKSSRHAVKLAYLAIGITMFVQIVGLVIGKAVGLW